MAPLPCSVAPAYGAGPRTWTSLISESMFSSPSAVAAVSGPDIGLISPIVGIVGGSCPGWVMLLVKGSAHGLSRMFGLVARE